MVVVISSLQVCLVDSMCWELGEGGNGQGKNEALIFKMQESDFGTCTQSEIVTKRCDFQKFKENIWNLKSF